MSFYGYGMRQRQRNVARRIADEYRRDAAARWSAVGRRGRRLMSWANDALGLEGPGGMTSWNPETEKLNPEAAWNPFAPTVIKKKRHSAKRKSKMPRRKGRKRRMTTIQRSFGGKRPRISTGGKSSLARLPDPVLVDKYGHRIPRGGRKGIYHVNSKFSTRFRGKRVLGVSNIRRLGVVNEDDGHADASSTRTVYLGHYTHPSKAVLNSIGMALSKYFGKIVTGHDPQSMEDEFGTTSANVRSGFEVEVKYRPFRESDSTNTSGFTIVEGSTYLSVGNSFRDVLYTICTADITAREAWIEHISIHPEDDATAGQYIHGRPYDVPAGELKLTVMGISQLKMQNTTLTASTGGSSDRHDVNANPLEGKEYFGYGSQHNLKYHNINAGGSDGALNFDSSTGVKNFAYSDPTDAEVDRILEFPPHHKSWWGVKSSNLCRLQPGEMTKSVLSAVHTMTLNQWIKTYYRGLAATGHANHPSTSLPTSIGKFRYFALDKMIHDDGDGNTLVTYEYHIKLIAVCKRHKRKHITMSYPAVV